MKMSKLMKKMSKQVAELEFEIGKKANIAAEYFSRKGLSQHHVGVCDQCHAVYLTTNGTHFPKMPRSIYELVANPVNYLRGNYIHDSLCKACSKNTLFEEVFSALGKEQEHSRSESDKVSVAAVTEDASKEQQFEQALEDGYVRAITEYAMGTRKKKDIEHLLNAIAVCPMCDDTHFGVFRDKEAEKQRNSPKGVQVWTFHCQGADACDYSSSVEVITKK
jgi:antitoxin component HigA of HigAB toxin-antitoxin module